MEEVRIITREELPQLTLGRAALAGDEEYNDRWKALHCATYFGNLREEKVTLFLQGEPDGVFQLETTLWACTSEWAVFKDGVRIPVESVIRVAFHQASEE